jgi:hypothetical protein
VSRIRAGRSILGSFFPSRGPRRRTRPAPSQSIVDPEPLENPIGVANRRAGAALADVNRDLERALFQEQVLLGQAVDDLEAHFQAWLAARERREQLELHARFLTLYIEALTRRAGYELGPRR